MQHVGVRRNNACITPNRVIPFRTFGFCASREGRGQAMNNRRVHGRNYRILAPLVTAAARRNPTTTCWSCGLTLDAHPPRNGKQQTWTAGHLVDGQPDHTLTLNDLRAEASGCNYSRGASYGNRQRTEPCSPEWK